ncbi:MAG: hydrogenase [Dehalococcoidia bacterium]|nr:hydrogenase [Dehalococcoidia bacterium]
MPRGQNQQGHVLIRAGVLPFLLGLLTGLLAPVLENRRMVLSSHLEGVLNGIFLVLVGLVWPRLNLPARWLRIALAAALVGTYTNWATTLAAAALGAGERLMPIAGAGFRGRAAEEALIAVGLGTLTVAMITTSVLVLTGLKDPPEGATAGPR